MTDRHATQPIDINSKRKRGTKPDGWDEAENSYSPEKFYPAASGKDGHSRVTSVRVSPMLLGMIAAIAQDPNYPDIKTVSDFFRDAAVHRMHYLHHELGADSILQADIMREIRASELARFRQRLEADRDIIKDTDEQLGALAADGDTESFEYVVTMSLDLADDFSAYSLRMLNDVIRRRRRELAESVRAGRGIDPDA